MHFLRDRSPRRGGGGAFHHVILYLTAFYSVDDGMFFFSLCLHLTYFDLLQSCSRIAVASSTGGLQRVRTETLFKGATRGFILHGSNPSHLSRHTCKRQCPTLWIAQPVPYGTHTSHAHTNKDEYTPSYGPSTHTLYRYIFLHRYACGSEEYRWTDDVYF